MKKNLNKLFTALVGFIVAFMFGGECSAVGFEPYRKAEIYTYTQENTATVKENNTVVRCVSGESEDNATSLAKPPGEEFGGINFEKVE